MAEYFFVVEYFMAKFMGGSFGRSATLRVLQLQDPEQKLGSRPDWTGTGHNGLVRVLGQVAFFC